MFIDILSFKASERLTSVMVNGGIPELRPLGVIQEVSEGVASVCEQ